MSTQTRRGLIILLLIMAPFIIGLLFTYQIIRIPIPSDMVFSPAVDFLEGPRIGPPEGAIPVQGEAIIPGELPLNPVPADEVSLQRGQILYQIHCALCHGETGQGDTQLASYFARTPANLTGSQATAQFDGAVFQVITLGFGQMPALAENLTVRERWDVVNYVRTLPSGSE